MKRLTAADRAEAKMSGMEVIMTAEYGVMSVEYREYRVNVAGGSEDTAYYTSDYGDAMGTMRAMARHRDAESATETGILAEAWD